MAYLLFLDDLRTVDTVYRGQIEKFVLARTYADFVNHIKANGLPGFMSFDNDLGEDMHDMLMPDGYACAKWLMDLTLPEKIGSILRYPRWIDGKKTRL